MNRKIRDIFLAGLFTPEVWFLIAFTGWGLGALYSALSGSRSTFDIQLHDTYIVIARIHLCLWLAIVFGAFGLFYHYNRRMGRILGLIHFGMTVLGSLLFIWPYHGLAGMPRRYMDYGGYISFNGFWGYEGVEFGLLMLGALGQVVFLVNIVYSMVGGRKSVD
jgi:cytochrome c oxidase subunit 1